MKNGERKTCEEEKKEYIVISNNHDINKGVFHIFFYKIESFVVLDL